MQIIGLLGGIASGKSTVARLLADQGAVVLDADHAAGEALATEGVKQAIVERWGSAVLDSSGQLDRRVIARHVFGSSQQAAAERKFLEGLIHPLVRQTLKAELNRLEQAATAVVVLDIPLLIEAGWADDCDHLFFVDSPEADRLARAQQRGWDAEELHWREAAQLPISEKRRRASVVIDNSGSTDVLRQQVADHWRRLTGKPAK